MSTYIEATITIFERPEYGGAPPLWLMIAGEMFGPFEALDQALDAIPEALRSLP